MPQNTKYDSGGFRLSESDAWHGFSHGPVVAQVPDSLIGYAVSVCGTKALLIDEGIRWEHNGRQVTTCAKVAALAITDSPIHRHGITEEIYIILSGQGTMFLNYELVEVKKGTVILIPPSWPHGLVCADALKGIPNETAEPVVAILVFTPGLAPKTNPDQRDEEILHERTSTEILRMSGPQSA